MIRWSALLVAAILGLAPEARAEHVQQSAGVAWQADGDQDFVAAPLPAACVVAVQLPSLHPGPAEVENVPALRAREGAVPPRIERQAVLVSAQVFEKYGAFRESLRTP